VPGQRTSADRIGSRLAAPREPLAARRRPHTNTNTNTNTNTGPWARRHLLLLAGLFATLAILVPGQAFAQTLVGRVDRAQVTLGESVIYEVTLSLSEGQAEGYKPPDFRGFRVLDEQPSRSTQIQMGGGKSLVRTVYTWRYELSPTQSGRVTIGAARVRANGTDLRTNPVPITVLAGDLTPDRSRQAPAPPPPRAAPRMRQPRSPFADLFGGDEPVLPAPAGGQGSFLRAVGDKNKVFVGEQVVVEWLLYLTERQDKYQAVAEPRTDGFWSEELTVPHNQGSLALTQQLHEGRLYLVAPLMRKALFPLQAGKLTVTPLESEISQVDFFGRTLRTERLKAQPLEIEVLPLPGAGRPDDFDPANVGLFAIDARVDRNKVGVGEAVTLLVTVSGQGNLRKFSMPRLGAIPGWKTYEPKVEVRIENESGIAGSRSVEYLLLPERPGPLVLPALAFSFFDPAGRRYVTEKTPSLRIEVLGEAKAGGRIAGTSPGSSNLGGLENVLPAEIRPPRTRPALRRDLGATLYRSPAFVWTLLAPPALFGVTVVMGRLRERWGQDTDRGRRRKARRLIRHHLQAAERQLQADRPAAFYMEIDRVLREVLIARLRRPITGLPREELAALIAGSGLGPEVASQVLSELDACDRARFAPGTVGPGEMRASLERAAELILQIERAPEHPGRASA
jgi:hypothetical protein